MKFKRKPTDKILSGDMVFFLCRNPATGRVKRVSHRHGWAEVEWNDGSGFLYTKRHPFEHLRLLCPVLNEWMGV